MAYLLFYRLLGAWGPTRVSLVAYLLPVWGIALGALVLSEVIHEGLLIGTALVIGGIALVNLQSLRALVTSRRAEPAEPEVAAIAEASEPR